MSLPSYERGRCLVCCRILRHEPRGHTKPLRIFPPGAALGVGGGRALPAEDPLTPAPSPPEYRGRGEKDVPVPPNRSGTATPPRLPSARSGRRDPATG